MSPMSPKFLVLCTPPNEFGGGTEPTLLEFTRDGIPVPLAYARGTELARHVPEIPSGHVSHVSEILSHVSEIPMSLITSH